MTVLLVGDDWAADHHDVELMDQAGRVLARARLSEGAAALAAALADSVGLRLISIVAEQGEVCSCNLEQPLGKSQPTISHHTRVLAQAGLIEGDKRGKWTWWRIVPARLAAVRQALSGT